MSAGGWVMGKEPEMTLARLQAPLLLLAAAWLGGLLKHKPRPLLT